METKRKNVGLKPAADKSQPQIETISEKLGAGFSEVSHHSLSVSLPSGARQSSRLVLFIS